MLYNRISGRIPIQKGWAPDKKYKVIIDERPYLLRISSEDSYLRIMGQHKAMSKVATLGIPMCHPVEFGICPEGIYVLHSWVDGRDAEDVLMAASEEIQYAYGLDAGRILHRIHSIPAPEDAQDWELRFNRKIDRKLVQYGQCPLKYEEDETMLRYLAENRHLLKNRPQCYQHGDYHVGNMMIDNKGVLTIIDFEKDDYGDPWEEFNRIVWCAQKVPAMARGMVDGYFDGHVPVEFWQLLALYICSNSLGSLPWAVSFGQREIQVMRSQQREILFWYDGMKNVVPSWYRTH